MEIIKAKAQTFVSSSMTTCCKLPSAARIITGVWFVSSVGALVYLQDTNQTVAAKLTKQTRSSECDYAARGMLSSNSHTPEQAGHIQTLTLRWWAVV